MAARKETKARIDIYQDITDKVLASLEKGIVPWKKPWNADGLVPTSLSTGNPYRGINVLLLAMSEFKSPYWTTYRTALKLGGNVRKGEKGTRVVFWKWLVSKGDNGDDQDTTPVRSFPLLKCFTVFNVDQCDGLDNALPVVDVEDREFNPIREADGVIESYLGSQDGLSLSSEGGVACYSPSEDEVRIPVPERFSSEAGYYATAFHELGHSTGRWNRLDRFKRGGCDHFGSANYSKEELVAEMSSAFLMAEVGIQADETFDNAVAYIDGWRKKISEDKRLIVSAAQQAQKAADLIMGRKHGETK